MLVWQKLCWLRSVERLSVQYVPGVGVGVSLLVARSYEMIAVVAFS
jgi:hypothetical protein